MSAGECASTRCLTLTHDQRRRHPILAPGKPMGAGNSAVVVDLPRWGPMLSPRVPNLVPIPGPRMERETPGQRSRPHFGHPQDPFAKTDAPHAYSSMRRYLAAITDARVLIGGKLAGFAGAMPGIVEEAIVAVQARHPLYVSAGFGGAAALVAQRLHLDDLNWAPEDFPARPDDERIDRGLQLLDVAAASSGWDAMSCGLDEQGVRQLAATHRASEIASLVVRGLARSRR